MNAIMIYLNLYKIHFIAFFLLCWVVVFFHILKWKVKKRYYSRFVSDLNKHNNDNIIVYYEKRYIVDLLYAITLWCLVFFYLNALHVNFAFLSVAIWAFILIIQPYIQSLISYLILQTRFKIGDVIKIDEHMGEIIFIKPLFIGITWRNDLWEHTGEIAIIPNNIFTTKLVVRLDIKAYDIRKNLISFIYDKELFHLSYRELLSELRIFLHNQLPIRTIEECGPYKSYIGHKFKLISKYEWRDLKITIWYLDSYLDSRDSMENIIDFIEWMKKENTKLFYS